MSIVQHLAERKTASSSASGSLAATAFDYLTAVLPLAVDRHLFKDGRGALSPSASVGDIHLVYGMICQLDDDALFFGTTIAPIIKYFSVRHIKFEN